MLKPEIWQGVHIWFLVSFSGVLATRKKKHRHKTRPRITTRYMPQLMHPNTGV